MKRNQRFFPKMPVVTLKSFLHVPEWRSDEIINRTHSAGQFKRQLRDPKPFAFVVRK